MQAGADEATTNTLGVVHLHFAGASDTVAGRSGCAAQLSLSSIVFWEGTKALSCAGQVRASAELTVHVLTLRVSPHCCILLKVG